MSFAADSVVATTYPGSFEEAYPAVLLPAFTKRTQASVTLTPLLAVNQVAKITAANDASVRFHLRHGFERVGTQREIGHLKGAWQDVVILQRILDAGDPPPAASGGG